MSFNSIDAEECASFSQHLNEIMDTSAEISHLSVEDVSLSMNEKDRDQIVDQLKCLNFKTLPEICAANFKNHQNELFELFSRKFYNFQLEVFIKAASHQMGITLSTEAIEELKKENKMAETCQHIGNFTDSILRQMFNLSNNIERRPKVKAKKKLNVTHGLQNSTDVLAESHIPAMCQSNGPALQSTSCLMEDNEKNHLSQLPIKNRQRKAYTCSRCHNLRRGHVCTENADSSVEYEVKAIRDRHLLPGGYCQNDADYIYRVSWSGFDEEDDTWEPLHSLENCKLKLIAFKRRMMAFHKNST